MMNLPSPDSSSSSSSETPSEVLKPFLSLPATHHPQENTAVSFVKTSLYPPRVGEQSRRFSTQETPIRVNQPLILDETRSSNLLSSSPDMMPDTIGTFMNTQPPVTPQPLSEEELHKLMDEYEAIPVEGTFQKSLPSWQEFVVFVQQSVWFKVSVGVLCLALVYYSDWFNPTASFVLDSYGVTLPVTHGTLMGSSQVGLAAPVQQAIPLNAQTTVVLKQGASKVELIKQARYTLTGKVMGTTHFDKLPITAWENEIIPTDVTLAWGQLAYDSPQKEVRYWQANREFFFASQRSSLTKEYILSHSSNTHLIPASENLRKALKAMHSGELVELQGFLVNVKPVQTSGVTEGVNDWWPTSMYRDDAGAWSSETMYVTRLKIGQKVYQ
ncbi:MAG: hypothetical protein ACKO37_00825 [Vampirovibrionales bacterium]